MQFILFQFLSQDGTSAIFLAARCGYANLLSILLESTMKNSTRIEELSRNDGITPLIMAAAMNHHEAVDVLLDFGANPNEESKVIIRISVFMAHFISDHTTLGKYFR